jgi:hypothetical protein
VLYHGEIRYRLLGALYINYVHIDPFGKYRVVDIIEKAGLNEEKETMIIGDLQYLIEKKLIDSFDPIGIVNSFNPINKHKTLIKINADGIDAVQKIPAKIKKIFEKSNNEDIKKLLDELSEDLTTTEKITNTFNKIKKVNLPVYYQIINIFRELLENLKNSDFL